jgi:anthranilate 1,2-dioxygenase small subunit
MTDLQLVAKTQDFLFEYAACLDEERFEDWTALFDPDGCTYEILSRENHDLNLPAPIMGCYSYGMVKDRVHMLIKNTLTYRHMYMHRQVSNVRARRSEGGLIHATAGLVVHQSDEEGVSSIYMIARYRAQLKDTDGTFRIQKMGVIVDSFGIDTMLAVPL